MSCRIRPRTAPDRGCLSALSTALLLLLLLLFLALPSSAVAAVAAAPAVAAQAESRPQWGETLLLALKINGVPQDAMLRAVRLSEGLAVPQSSWDELHLRLPATGKLRVIDGEQHVLIENGSPLRWRIDEVTQTLEIEAPASAFVAQRVDLAPGVPTVTEPSAWAPFINYDAQWQRDSGSRSIGDALWELGLFGPHGDFSSTGLTRTEARGVRLDTRWQHDMPERLARLTVGDAINQAGAWGRPVRFGGLQWGTDFSLQPGFLSFPLPTLRGEAALPSTLDVYVNNGQRLQSRLQPGAFDLTDLPVVTGQGEIKTVVKDLLGREQVVVTPYYVSPALLKPGLRAGSIEVGTIREDYGIASNRYGRGLLTATERRGLSDRFTGELHAELTRSQQALGVSGWMLWPALGTASASAVASRSSTLGGGWMLAAGLDRQARDWSGSIQVRRIGASFSQLGQADGTAPRLVVAAAFGTAWRGQSIGVGYTLQHGGPVESRLAQLNYGTGLGRFGYLGLAVFRDFSPGGSGTSLSLSWSYALDERHSAGLSAQRQPDGRGGSQTQLQAQLQRNAGIGSGLGYQLLAETGGRQLAQATWQGEHAVLSGGVARRGADTEVRAGASGGFALLDGSVFYGRRVEGGIALVDVGGHAGVRVLQDNQVVAHTDAQGRAFVTGLRGYQSNRVGIDAADLPMDAELDALEIRLTPAARSAAYIDFPVRRGRSASLRVLDTAGRPLPPGTLLQPARQPRSYPVGYDGRAYLAGLAEGPNQAAAAWPDGHCQLDFTLPPQGDDDDLPDLGALTCR